MFILGKVYLLAIEPLVGSKEQKREVASELSFWLYFSPNLSIPVTQLPYGLKNSSFHYSTIDTEFY